MSGLAHGRTRMNEAQKNIRPGKTWYFISIVLFLVGGIGGPIWFVINFISLFSSGEQFLVPTIRTFMFEKPGKYVIWHDAKVFFQGKNYSFPSELPGDVTIKVVKNKTLNELTLKPSTCTEESSGNHKRYSICSFPVDTPGEYTLEVSGLKRPHVFTLRKSMLKELLFSFLLCGPITLIGCAGAPLIIVIVAIKRR